MNLTTDSDPTSIPDEWLIERMRLHRNALLAASDWTQTLDSPVDRDTWATYRQALRDFPANWTPAPTVNFPQEPR